MNNNYRQEGIISKVFFGKEDHGILTCMVYLDFAGSSQGFGCLAFSDPNKGVHFVNSLCSIFDINEVGPDVNWVLRDRRCIALRCFGNFSDPIEGLENPENGKKFTITEWCRIFDKDAPDPLQRQQQEIRNKISYLERRLREEKIELSEIAAVYRPT